MKPFFLFPLFFVLLNCFSKEKTNQVIIRKSKAQIEYDYKIFKTKDSLKVKELITSFMGEESILANPETFLYMDFHGQIHIAIYLNNEWHTWIIHDANNEEYYAKIKRIDFDNNNHEEIIIQSKYGIVPQSTFGRSYFGDFQIWNPDSIKPYFNIENYRYSDDMGRNGDHSYRKECFLKVEVMKKQLIVSHENSGSKENITCDFDSELIGKYDLKNDSLIKIKTINKSKSY